VLALAETFGSRLARLMDERGVTNAELADAVNVHEGTISYWRGGQLPRQRKRELVANFFGVPLSYLDHGIDSSSSGPSRVSEERPVGSWAKHRLPPAVYDFVYRCLIRMRDAGCSEEQIDWAERLLGEYSVAKLHADPRREKTVEEQLIDVEAAWKAVRESVQRHSGIVL
jgi:transcriptional regulator with XRE-family HTH domain